MLTLRGHHLLCLPRFRGQGYSAVFNANMARIAQSLAEEPEQIVCLTDTFDDICRACPHQSEDGCALDEDGRTVADRDRRILALLNLTVGACVSYAQLSEKLAAVADRALPEKACTGCRWLRVCSRLAQQ